MSERKTTRFAVLEAERVVKVHEREIPALKADEVLIKNGACNICTTDYGQYTGARKNLMFPMAWGHEFAGTIVDMGSDVKEFEVGEMVGIGYDNCGECEFCLSLLAFITLWVLVGMFFSYYRLPLYLCCQA